MFPIRPHAGRSLDLDYHDTGDGLPIHACPHWLTKASSLVDWGNSALCKTLIHRSRSRSALATHQVVDERPVPE